MTCIEPGEISEEQLLTYADGEADSRVADHIRRCPYCAERARTLATHQSVLRTLFHRLECPDPQTLGEYHLGMLPSPEGAAVKDHLKICTSCTEEVAELERFLQAVPITPAMPSLSVQLRRVVARLASTSVDSGHPQPSFALRGMNVAAPGVYQAEDIKLVVGLEADGLRAGHKMLLGFTSREGQPLASLAGARVLLNRGGAPFAVEEVDTLGNFAFSNLNSGEYELVLVTDREQVVVETILV